MNEIPTCQTQTLYIWQVKNNIQTRLVVPSDYTAPRTVCFHSVGILVSDRSACRLLHIATWKNRLIGRGRRDQTSGIRCGLTVIVNRKFKLWLTFNYHSSNTNVNYQKSLLVSSSCSVVSSRCHNLVLYSLLIILNQK